MSLPPPPASTRRGGAASVSNCRWCWAANGRCPASTRRCSPRRTCGAGSRCRWSVVRIPDLNRRPAWLSADGLSSSAGDWQQWQRVGTRQFVRYPDQRMKTLDPRFTSLVLGNAAIEVIASGCRFNEGPVWFGDLRRGERGTLLQQRTRQARSERVLRIGNPPNFWGL